MQSNGYFDLIHSTPELTSKDLNLSIKVIWNNMATNLESQGFCVGWMRWTLVYNRSLRPSDWETWHLHKFIHHGWRVPSNFILKKSLPIHEPTHLEPLAPNLKLNRVKKFTIKDYNIIHYVFTLAMDELMDVVTCKHSTPINSNKLEV